MAGGEDLPEHSDSPVAVWDERSVTAAAGYKTRRSRHSSSMCSDSEALIVNCATIANGIVDAC